jgi:membrane-bound lytic murein transglycosylase A
MRRPLALALLAVITCSQPAWALDPLSFVPQNPNRVDFGGPAPARTPAQRAAPTLAPTAEPPRPAAAPRAAVRVDPLPAPRRPPVDPLTPIAFQALPGWANERHGAALMALRTQCTHWRQMNPARAIGPQRFGTVAEWLAACQRLDGVAPGDAAARTAIEAAFRPVAIGTGTGLVTGYYEPHLSGSRVRTAKHTVPLYRRPEGWKGRLPTRAQIANGALAGKGLELVWVDSAIDAFFLEIQGSGLITLTDGQTIGVSYAGQNGHPYFAIGQALIKWGEVDRAEMSMAAIRQWLLQHPDRQRDLKDMNRSYVFFKERPADVVRGAAGVPLVAGRSLAIDPRFVPYGAPVWLDLSGAPTPDGRLQRLVIAHDTGGAIKGAQRGDLFWGSGPDAADGAGRMMATGTQHVLVPAGLSLSAPSAPPLVASARKREADRRARIANAPNPPPQRNGRPG